MRLSKIKLAGFKSFVDPTSIELPTNLTAVVGPNGCGKSNIIDAVRWVMGESSAKHLRGDSMADVIFNGSSARQPVGAASIELVFDNSDGSLGGEYASYAEISIKRTVSRDGTSVYALNGTRCRRKDITGIFLGTGLGPRSYGIIEQGMITRIIDAKPDELRVYLEEAAGISKYKERRRETENRIRHTRENLSRLEDLRDEIEKQLSHLQRQARTAERYKRYKEEERRRQGELLLLRQRGLQDAAGDRKRLEQEHETRVESAVAELRRVEKDIEAGRSDQENRTEAFNEVQGRYYKLGAEVARLEQSIQHGRELRKRQKQELEQAQHQVQDLTHHLERDQEQQAVLAATVEELEPAVERARAEEAERLEALHAAEGAMQAWQADWETFNQSSGETTRSSEVEKKALEHLEQQLDELIRRQERLGEERTVHDPAVLDRELTDLGVREKALDGKLVRSQGELETVHARISELRDTDKDLTRRLDEGRQGLQDARGRIASIEALQQAALGKSASGSTAWLEKQGLSKEPRLAETLDVESGWERAVETVLGDHLEAVCVDGLDPLADVLGELESGSLLLVDAHAEAAAAAADALASKVRSDAAGALLSGVRAADDLRQALALRSKLGPGESVVTRDGIWMGRHWIRVSREEDGHAGVLARESELRELTARRSTLEKEVEVLSVRHEETRLQLSEFEARREELQADVNRMNREQAGLKAQIDGGRNRLEQTQVRLASLDEEIQDIEGRVQETDRAIRAARGRLEGALGELEGHEDARGELLERREQLRRDLEAARGEADAARESLNERRVRLESRRSALESLVQNLGRMRGQLERLESRSAELRSQLGDEDVDPEQDQRAKLETALEQRVAVEQELAEARRQLEAVQARIRELDQARADAENKVQETRETLSQARLSGEEVRVRLETVKEQLAATGLDPEELAAHLPEGATVEEHEESLAQLSRRIERLGPINLAAIDEYDQQSERKQYLDAQHADLIEALDTLENAIRKIDRETRTRFKETFDRVNAGLKSRFPRLFAGGHAYLELTGEDLLDAGVAIMARPPGKRNSTIHLLSGGEKALTAVALVFAIFDLNPAPFCMLDEVDAPLDDANVGRFSELVKEMAENVQVVLITHNKVTMEMAHQLMGVTMSEPGVSRMVAVDIDEAVQLAAV